MKGGGSGMKIKTSLNYNDKLRRMSLTVVQVEFDKVTRSLLTTRKPPVIPSLSLTTLNAVISRLVDIWKLELCFFSFILDFLLLNIYKYVKTEPGFTASRDESYQL